MSLLEQAKQHPVRMRNSKPEEKELAIAWIKDEISNVQASFALTGKHNQTVALYRLAHALKDLFKEQKIVLK